jgi:hypothetical protein
MTIMIAALRTAALLVQNYWIMHRRVKQSLHPGLQILERPPVVSASNQDVAPGAFPMAPSRNTATSRSFSSPISSYDSTREFRNEEAKLDNDVSNMAAESGLFTVEARWVPDGNVQETMMVVEAEYVRMTWFQRPACRWILLGSILFVCGVVITVVVLVVRSPSTASSSSMASPTPAPTSLTPVRIACNFLAIPNVTICQSIYLFSA